MSLDEFKSRHIVMETEECAVRIRFSGMESGRECGQVFSLQGVLGGPIPELSQVCGGQLGLFSVSFQDDDEALKPFDLVFHGLRVRKGGKGRVVWC